MAFIKCMNQVAGGSPTIEELVIANVTNPSYTHYTMTPYSNRCEIYEYEIAVDETNHIGYMYADIYTETSIGKSSDWYTMTKHTIPSAQRPAKGSAFLDNAVLGDNILWEIESDYIFLPKGSITQAGGEYKLYLVWMY